VIFLHFRSFLHATPEGFDLVITYHTMPAMTGAALAQELRRWRPELPGILCSGFRHTMHADKAEALGLAAFLFKPFLHRDPGLAVRRGLEERRAQSF
jgi:DNA-binding NtrC family response regulator